MSKVKRINSASVTKYPAQVLFRKVLLILLPVPSGFCVLFQLVTFDMKTAFYAAVSTVGFIAAAVRTAKSLQIEEKSAEPAGSQLKSIFRQLQGSMAFALSTGVVLRTLIQFTLPQTIFYSLGLSLVFAGVFGVFRKQEKHRIIPLGKIDKTELIKQARKDLAVMQDVAEKNRKSVVAAKICAVANITERIISFVEQATGDVREVRKTLKVYLPQVKAIINNYSSVELEMVSDRYEVEERFLTILSEVEDGFYLVYQKLMENKAINMELDFEVLESRLREEKG